MEQLHDNQSALGNRNYLNLRDQQNISDLLASRSSVGGGGPGDSDLTQLLEMINVKNISQHVPAGTIVPGYPQSNHSYTGVFIGDKALHS